MQLRLREGADRALGSQTANRAHQQTSNGDSRPARAQTLRRRNRSGQKGTHLRFMLTLGNNHLMCNFYNIVIYPFIQFI